MPKNTSLVAKFPDFCNKMGGSFNKNIDGENMLLSCVTPLHNKNIWLGTITFQFKNDSLIMISPKAGVIDYQNVKYVYFKDYHGTIKDADADKHQMAVRCEELKAIDLNIVKAEKYYVNLK